MLETVMTLCGLPGVSGREEKVRDYILERVMSRADSIETDAMGNLLVFKKGAVTPQRRIMLCAHMDEVGIIVTGVTEAGWLRFDFVGGVDRRVAIGKKVVLSGGAVGVIGIKAFHLVSDEEEKKVPKTGELYIDIGAADREEALTMTFLGDTGTFLPGTVQLGGDLLAAKALDDRIGCAVMLCLLEDELPCDCWFAFTVQEEVGCRGAQTAAYTVEPDIALVLEGTTAADLPGVDSGKQVCCVGKGVVVPFMDKGTIYDKDLYKILMALADENGIAVQTKRAIAGGTDARAVQRSRGGVRTAGLACALRNIHSPLCIGHTGEFEDMLTLAKKFLEKAAKEEL